MEKANKSNIQLIVVRDSTSYLTRDYFISLSLLTLGFHYYSTLHVRKLKHQVLHTRWQTQKLEVTEFKRQSSECGTALLIMFRTAFCSKQMLASFPLFYFQASKCCKEDKDPYLFIFSILHCSSRPSPCVLFNIYQYEDKEPETVTSRKKQKPYTTSFSCQVCLMQHLGKHLHSEGNYFL